MLATVGVEGRVTGPERRHRVIKRELNQRHEGGPVVGPLAGKGAQDVGNDTVDALDLARGVVVVRRAEDERSTSASCKPVQKALVKRVLRSETST